MVFRFVVLLLAAVALAPPASGGELGAIIKKNQDTLRGRVQQLQRLDVDRVALPPARLWIHRRGADQEGLIEWIDARSASLTLDGGPIERKPVQSVDFGPRVSQLRFFKPEDRDRASVLVAALHERIPDLMLSDFTEQYAKVSWLQAGHLELWLAPDLR